MPPETPPAPTFEVLPQRQTWTEPARAAAELPGGPAVVLLEDASGRPVQLLTAQQARKTVQARLSGQSEDDQPTLRADLSEVVRAARWREVWSPFESRWWYYRAARLLYPDRYRKLISFGPVWFLQIDPRHNPREIRVTDQVWQSEGPFIGPWNYHKEAQRALETLWDLFDLCRHPEQLRRTPHGRRCPYADMGRCDAPCDGSVPPQAMDTRTADAWRFLRGETDRTAAVLHERMQSHARGQRFEQAAQVKQQLAVVEEWNRRTRWRTQPDTHWNLLCIIPATRRKASRPFLFRRGVLEEGPVMQDRKLLEQLPTWAGAALGTPPADTPPVQRMEQAWLMAHFLDRVESRQSLVVRLGDAAALPADLDEHLRGYLDGRSK